MAGMRQAAVKVNGGAVLSRRQPPPKDGWYTEAMGWMSVEQVREMFLKDAPVHVVHSPDGCGCAHSPVCKLVSFLRGRKAVPVEVIRKTLYPDGTRQAAYQAIHRAQAKGWRILNVGDGYELRGRDA